MPLSKKYSYFRINAGLAIREWEGGFVAGTIAGIQTKTKKLGTIGSFLYPVIKGTLDAFENEANYFVFTGSSKLSIN